MTTGGMTIEGTAQRYFPVVLYKQLRLPPHTTCPRNRLRWTKRMMCIQNIRCPN
jgi:hypothetical protein